MPSLNLIFLGVQFPQEQLSESVHFIGRLYYRILNDEEEICVGSTYHRLFLFCKNKDFVHIGYCIAETELLVSLLSHRNISIMVIFYPFDFHITISSQVANVTTSWIPLAAR